MCADKCDCWVPGSHYMDETRRMYYYHDDNDDANDDLMAVPHYGRAMCEFFLKDFTAEYARHTVPTRSLVSEDEHAEDAVVYYHTLCVELLVAQVEGIEFLAHNIYAFEGATEQMGEVSRKRRGGGRGGGDRGIG